MHQKRASKSHTGEGCDADYALLKCLVAPQDPEPTGGFVSVQDTSSEWPHSILSYMNIFYQVESRFIVASLVFSSGC